MTGSQVIGGRYEIQAAPIGQGGMGVVFKAYDTVTKRFVALKTMWGNFDPAAVELFEKEWTVLARLSHPNIVDILDTGEYTENGQRKPYFVMPLLPGATLDTLIKEASQRLTVERTVEIISQACRGLQAAHDQGLVHRDLKPSNIFVMDDDTVKIIDFGVVHLADARTVTGIKGTLQYMAPEQLEMKPATPLSDIFSLGVVCYETLTLRKPFARKSEAEVVDAIRTHVPPPASEISPSVNALVSRTVHKAMAKQPYHRFSNAREFADTLRKALRNEHIERFDRTKIQPRIERTKKAFGEGDYQFALEILTELESEGNIDPEMSLLRIQIEQAKRSKTVRQLIDSARIRMDEDEFPLALQKVQDVLEIDPSNVDALAIKSQIERQRSARQIDNWFRLAQQHLENQLFSQSRQAVEEILKVDASNTHARSFLADVDRKEEEAAKIREEKQKLYEAALSSYKNGAITTALSKLEQVLDLGRQLSANPQTDAQYQVFYNQIRSERDAIHNGYAEGRKALADRNFERALEICNEFLSRRPGDPMFKSLKIEVEETQRQEKSAAIAEINQRVEAEADLDRKFNILKEAKERYPNEPLFQQSLQLIKERRDLVNSIIARARHFEESGQFNEACSQWDILRNIYRQYPGLDFEIQRLDRRREEQAREEAKARWVEKVDRSMASGEYDRAGDTAQQALGEFPEDGELTRLQKLAELAQKKSREAHSLLEEGQQLCAGKDCAAGIEKLRQALRLDEKNHAVRAGLVGALVEHARALVGQDWRAAEPVVAEALDVEGSDPVAKSLASLIDDYRRREIVDGYLTEVRDLQAAGDLEGARAKLEQGLAAYPNEIRLSQLYGNVRAAVDARRGEARKKVEPADLDATALFSPAQGTPMPAETIVQPLSTSRQPAAPEPAAPGKTEAPAVPGRVSPLPAAPPPTPTKNAAPPVPPPEETRSSGHGAPPAPKKKSSWLLLGAAAVVVIAIASYVIVKHQSSGAATPAPVSAAAASVKFSANVDGVRYLVDGHPVPGGDVSLPPGAHSAEADADGYQRSVQSFTVPAGASGPITVQFTLQPALPELRITSDLKAGKVVIDGKDTADLQEGNIVKDGLPPGDHTLKILDNGREVFSFPFTVTPKEAVTITGPIQSSQTSGTVVSSFGGNARVYASSGLKGNLSGQSLQPIPASGLPVTLVSSAPSDFVVQSGNQQNHLNIALSPVPVLSVQLGAERNTGTLLVQSNVPDAQVFVNGEQWRKPLADGSRLIVLSPQTYSIKLSRDGYQDSPAQTVEIRKGEQQQLQINLTAMPQKATLAFDGLPAGAEVIIDGVHAGITNPAGNFSSDVAPGRHAVTLHKAGYEDTGITREWQAGINKVAGVQMAKAATGTLSFEINPGNARISFRRAGDTAAHDAKNGSSVSVKPGDYQVTANADGYTAKTSTVAVATGKEMVVDWTLASSKKASPTGIDAFENAPDWKADGAWYSHQGSGDSWLRHNQGSFTFAILKQVSKRFGFSRFTPVEWSVDDKDGSRIEYSLDNKQLRRRVIGAAGKAAEKRIDISLGSKDYFTLQVAIADASVTVGINGKTVDTVKRPDPSAPLGKFGFHGSVELVVQVVPR
ncbi:MAG TPA: protein kinase [Bryobacteraceae bacterium]|nr:protein kinase [Bryobacteraceae bacterium]